MAIETINNSGVQKVRKRPVIVEAIHFTPDNGPAIIAWMDANSQPIIAGFSLPPQGIGIEGGDGTYLLIRTNEGEMRADLNDWIIKGVHGEFYPCKPDIFAETYDIVEDEAPVPEMERFQAFSSWKVALLEARLRIVVAALDDMHCPELASAVAEATDAFLDRPPQECCSDG